VPADNEHDFVGAGAVVQGLETVSDHSRGAVKIATGVGVDDLTFLRRGRICLSFVQWQEKIA